jgi:hypothetical protein
MSESGLQMLLMGAQKKEWLREGYCSGDHTLRSLSLLVTFSIEFEN